MSNIAVFPVVRAAVPSAKNGKVHNQPPRRDKNSTRREREYLTGDEVEALVKAARARGRWGHRDAALILLAYRHGLRASEVTGLKWDAVDLDNRQLHITRRKNGKPSVHPLRDAEIRELRRLHREVNGSPYVFQSERLGKLSTRSVHYLVTEAGKAAGLPFPVHPHMLRHGCGYKLANDGADTRLIQDYLGHRNITHTVRYTELNAGRFSDFFED